MADFWSIVPLSYLGIGSAILCGVIIGLERQWNGKPAGIRTSILICLSAYIFVAIGKYFYPDDSARIIGQIVTGVGFLGAGVILSRHGFVQGVTSAAVIWVLAAIGSLIGMHRFGTALLVSVITVLLLIGIGMVERSTKKLQKGVHKQEESNPDS